MERETMDYAETIAALERIRETARKEWEETGNRAAWKQMQTVGQEIISLMRRHGEI